MSTERATAPLDADLEEDTDLPPPAPGLRSPIADHSFDPPTLPGIVAPHRRLPLSDRAFEEEHTPPTHDLPAHIAEQRRDRGPTTAASATKWAEPTEWEALPQREPAPELVLDHTLRMQLPPLQLPPEPARPESGSPAALPPLPIPVALPSSYRSEPTESRHPHSPPTQTLPEVGQLPPLPPTPEHDSLLAGLRYSRAVFRSLRKRRRLQEQLRQSERGDLDALDRTLVRLGQRAYTDHLDLLDWHPLFAGGWAEEPAATNQTEEQLVAKRAERAGARLQALAQREVAALRTREAELESELRQQGEVLRRHQADVFALDRRTRGVPAFHPLHHQHQEAEIAAAKTLDAVVELAQHLGRARAERLLHERIYAHAQPPAEQLAVALSPKLAAAQRRSPHLLVLGALLASAGIGSTPTGPSAASYLTIWQRITQLQTNLALRQTLFARLELDRQSYDRDAVQRAWLTVVVLTLALLGSAGLVCWVVSSR
jgi:hypothetical protein